VTGPRAEPRWFVVEARVDADELDVLSGRLWAVGAAGIEERTVGGQLQIAVAVPSARLEEVRTTLADRLLGVSEPAVDDGLDSWRAWARPTVVGHIVVEPAWWALGNVRPTGVIVRIDPGRAFGSGAHVTTRLALEMLQRAEPRGRTVLDVGTGSGVLAVAAAALGAKRVVGIDVDEVARAVARTNSELNQVDAVVEIADASIAEVTEQFEVVVANIDASTLIDCAPLIAARLAPSGILILSGLLETRESDVTAKFPDVACWSRRTEQDWVALSGERVRRLS
jgi:ribosomal protein L11 methyltransferase